VDPTQLRAIAEVMAQYQQTVHGLAGEAHHVTASAPSYDGQFGPPVHAIGAEAASRLRRLAELLGERSEFLLRKAAEFEAADQAVLASILGTSLDDLLAMLLSPAAASSPPPGLPTPTFLTDEAWRALLAELAANPPRSPAEVEAALLRAGMTQAQLSIFEGNHPGAVPAVFNLFAARPDVQFTSDLQFTLTPQNSAITYESHRYGSFGWTVPVVETSLVSLMGPQPGLASTYAVSDVPITIRFPAMAPMQYGLPPGQNIYGYLNGQLQDVPTVDVFLHGYQSTRQVWNQEMGNWMQLSDEPTIGFAFGGMGNEGDGLGSGQYPFYPRQYAFQTMETLDLLGLYGKDINVIGHSMGGAAAMYMGIAVDEMGGPNPPHMRYILLAPAVGPDSVPFLTEGWTGPLINWQNTEGSFPVTQEMRPYVGLTNYPAGSPPLMPQDFAYVGNSLAGGAVVDYLLPGAPEYIHDVHSQFANQYGFNTLAATANGLTTQPFPDPTAVQSFLNNNHVLVVAANQDRLVSADEVRRIFGTDVLSVNGNQYAHLPNSSDPSAAGSPAAIFEAAREILNLAFP
jgi:pimeloyl-ACP methyl ester carboxylesterase